MSESAPAEGSAAPNGRRAGPRYVLITECLQNDFFLNHQCRLCLPERVAARLLVGASASELPHVDRDGGIAKPFAGGPLGLFLEATVGRRLHGLPDAHGFLDVINIRDWHVPGSSYDEERRLYGPHCEKGTWGAGYVDGLEAYLDPNRTPDDQEAFRFEAGSVRIHHVHSDSLFDFRPRHDADTRTRRGKFLSADLEEILDEIVEQADAAGDPDGCGVYVAVIGVFTDLKIKLLLGGLRTRYSLPNLAVSDTLTASWTLERHLEGLDFVDKVLKVEVIHGINDLVRFLGGSAMLDNERDIVGGESFARYRSYFADKQNVLAYQDEKLRDYLALTQRRSASVYERISRANTLLMVWGGLFLLLTLVAAILDLALPDRVGWQLPAVTGGLGVLQLVAAFFSRPMRDLQRNLTNLAVFKMILESHSLKTAFVRYHFTTPTTLREAETPAAAETAGRQIEMLREQLKVIEAMDDADYSALAALGFGPDITPATVAAEVDRQPSVPAGDGLPAPPSGS